MNHWHGEQTDSWFAHLAFPVTGEKQSTDWLDAVTDEEYNHLTAAK